MLLSLRTRDGPDGGLSSKVVFDLSCDIPLYVSFCRNSIVLVYYFRRGHWRLAVVVDCARDDCVLLSSDLELLLLYHLVSKSDLVF